MNASSQYAQCDGPTGKCLLPLGHSGDHWRPFPSSESIRKADAAQALTSRGQCPFCKARMTDETCPCWNREEAE